MPDYDLLRKMEGYPEPEETAEIHVLAEDLMVSTLTGGAVKFHYYPQDSNEPVTIMLMAEEVAVVRQILDGLP